MFSLNFHGFLVTFHSYLQSDIIYSPTLGTSMDVPVIPFPTPLMVNDLFGVCKLVFTHSDNQDGAKKDYCGKDIFGKNGPVQTLNNRLQSKIGLL